MGKLLITLSGARTDILDKCPGERLKFQSLGWALLITSGLAALSMWFALASVLGLNPFLAFPVAIVWGLVILGIDRWLITSMPAGSPRRWAMAIPRLALALLLGSLISTPIVLRIFQSEVNAQITLIKAQRANAYLRQAQHSAVDRQVAVWSNDVANLQSVITSGGQVPIKLGTDPQVVSLTRQRATELRLEHGFYEQWQCQLYGGHGCRVKGNGPLARASESSYLQAKAAVGTLTGQIQRREHQLEATNAQSRSARLRQAKAALPAAKSQLAAATARRNELQASFDAQNKTVNGILIRLQALNQLSDKGFTLNAVRILLFLVFLVIECLPVTVKLLQQPGNYENILQLANEAEARAARRGYRPQPRRPIAAATLDLPGIHDPRGALRDIWRPEDLPAWPSTERAQQFSDMPPEPDESEEHSRLDDDALRRMADPRAGVGADPVRAGDGTELHFSEDDL